MAYLPLFNFTIDGSPTEPELAFTLLILITVFEFDNDKAVLLKSNDFIPLTNVFNCPLYKIVEDCPVFSVVATSPCVANVPSTIELVANTNLFL